MYYRLFLTKAQEKSSNNLLIKAIERGKILDSGIKAININPYLLRFFKKRFNRPVI